MKSPRPMEVCILAGGLSSRMGRDKAALTLGGKTLLATIRAVARSTGLPVRIIRHDIVERCGPLGGVYTALKSSRADAILFLACDMPFLTTKFLGKLIQKFGPRAAALFSCADAKAGFPFILRRSALVTVESQLKKQTFSLHALAATLEAKFLHPNQRERLQLFNINTPDDRSRAQQMFRETGKNPSA
jgi:molybdopterin-guanine dinucleotide biosynthesis protein A